MLDTHYHLDFLPQEERTQFLKEASSRGIGVVAQTLLPSTFAAVANVPRPALGFHPWQITEETLERELNVFARELPRARYIGEIGLDFAPRHAATTDLQMTVLRRILTLVSADSTPRVLSIHSVRATNEVLNLLEECAGDHLTCVIHWFSGTSDELTRLMRLGGLISVNPMMLESKRGRAYVTQVPADRLLLESDLPAEASPALTAAQAVNEVEASLTRTCTTLSELRGTDMAPILADNATQRFGAIKK